MRQGRGSTEPSGSIVPTGVLPKTPRISSGRVHGADELASGRLVELLSSLRPPPLPISLVHPSGRLVPARVRVAIEALTAMAKGG